MAITRPGDTNAFNTYATASTMAGALLNTLTTGTLTGGEGGTINSTTVSNLLGAENYAIYDAMKDSITDRNYPRVYLNYLSFDESFNILPEECSITQMKGPDHVWNILTQPGYFCRKNGYVLAYVSNESDVVTFIDNTTFTIHYGQLQQEQHYYPHGLVLDAGLATGALKSNYLFEGNELQPHLNLQLSDFNYRQYDQQIGRFTSVDPLADASGQEMFSPYHFVGNDPANYTDPLGLVGTDRHGISDLFGPGGSLGMNIKVWYQNSWAKAMMSSIVSFMSAAAGIAGDGLSSFGDLFDGISFGGGQPGSGNSGSFSTSFTPPSPPAGKPAVAPTPTPGLVNGISGGGGNANTIAQREANAQNAANLKAYKEDMARNYAGSGHKAQQNNFNSPQTQNTHSVKATIIIFDANEHSKNGLGHTAIRIGDVVYGYYPGDQDYFYTMGVMKAQSWTEFSLDHENSFATAFELNLTQRQTVNLQTIMSAYVMNPGHYSIIGQQCTSIVATALLNSGVDVHLGNEFLPPDLRNGGNLSPRQFKDRLNWSQNKSLIRRKYVISY